MNRAVPDCSVDKHDETSPSKADLRVVAIDEQIEALTRERRELMPDTTIPCPKCGHRTRVADTVIVHHQSYIPPSGCTGGDYWTTSCLAVQCGACGVECREDMRQGGKLTASIPHAGGNMNTYRDGYSQPEVRLFGLWDAELRKMTVLAYGEVAGWRVVDESRTR